MAIISGRHSRQPEIKALPWNWLLPWQVVVPKLARKRPVPRIIRRIVNSKLGPQLHNRRVKDVPQRAMLVHGCHDKAIGTRFNIILSEFGVEIDRDAICSVFVVAL